MLDAMFAVLEGNVRLEGFVDVHIVKLNQRCATRRHEELVEVAPVSLQLVEMVVGLGFLPLVGLRSW